MSKQPSASDRDPSIVSRLPPRSILHIPRTIMLLGIAKRGQAPGEAIWRSDGFETILYPARRVGMTGESSGFMP